MCKPSWTGGKRGLAGGDYEIIKLIEAPLISVNRSMRRPLPIKRLCGSSSAPRRNQESFPRLPARKTLILPEEESEPKKQPGHDRNGADAYKKAERIKVSIQDLKAGEPCRECPKGRLYPVKKAGTLVRFVGMAPLAAKIYELAKLRCNLCGEVFTAHPPGDVGSEKYDETAGAMVAVLKYGSGVLLPIEKLRGRIIFLRPQPVGYFRKRSQPIHRLSGTDPSGRPRQCHPTTIPHEDSELVKRS